MLLISRHGTALGPITSDVSPSKHIPKKWDQEKGGQTKKKRGHPDPKKRGGGKLQQIQQLVIALET